MRKILFILLIISLPVLAGSWSGDTWDIPRVNIFIDGEIPEDEKTVISSVVSKINSLKLPLTLVLNGSSLENIEPHNEYLYLKRDQILIFKYNNQDAPPGRTYRSTLRNGDILYSSTYYSSTSYKTNRELYLILLHEIMHAIGLDHTISPYERIHRSLMEPTVDLGRAEDLTYDDLSILYTAYGVKRLNSISIETDTSAEYIFIRNIRDPSRSISIELKDGFRGGSTNLPDGYYKLVLLKGSNKFKQKIIKLTRDKHLYLRTRAK